MSGKENVQAFTNESLNVAPPLEENWALKKRESQPPTTPVSPESASESTSPADGTSSVAPSPPLGVQYYSVRVQPPAVPPQQGAIFFRFTVQDTLNGTVWRVERRYSACEALHNSLWWRNTGHSLMRNRPIAASYLGLLPGAQPAPGYDLALLEARATALQAWASAVLSDGCALEAPEVVAFFGLQPPDGAGLDELAEAHVALATLQATDGKGWPHRKATCECDCF